MKAELKSAHTIIEKYASLLDISRRINSEKNFDELINVIAVEAATLLDAERATIFLLDKQKGELWAKVALGVEDKIRFNARLGIAGAVMVSGKMMVVEDAYQSPFFYPSIDSHTGFHTRNVLSVPMRNAERQIIGVFQVLNKKYGKFLPEDEQFIEAVASQAAIGIENAKAMIQLEVRQQALIEENQSLRKEVEDRFTARRMLGTTEKMDQIRSLIEKIADSDVSVLITGENGTGKELSARAVHYMSARRNKPFVAVNCAALPDTLIEAELFGIEKGVATGVEKRMGRIESANHGTLFLDEIADLSLMAQAKLLRVLQEREVEWVGGRRPISVDVRLLAATNKDLKEEIQHNRFRSDLYFRLNVIDIHMPSLRDIRSDIPLLATHFLRRYCKEVGKAVTGISPDALKALTTYHWPGNVRELENEIKRAVVLTSGSEIELHDLSDSIREERLVAPQQGGLSSSGGGKQSLKERVTLLEMQMIRDAMLQANNDRRRAASLLRLSHQGLINKLKRYGLQD